MFVHPVQSDLAQAFDTEECALEAPLAPFVQVGAEDVRAGHDRPADGIVRQHGGHVRRMAAEGAEVLVEDEELPDVVLRVVPDNPFDAGQWEG